MKGAGKPGKKSGPEKAYKNLEFLNSPDARMVRVMCEFAEPESRFRKLGVKNTIVMFGSARISPLEPAQARLSEVEARYTVAKPPPPELDVAYDRAKRDVHMARYYEDAAALSERLTRWSMALPAKRERFLICSGGGPGIMEAANKGAHTAGGRSVSLNISLPFEQQPNGYQTRELAFVFHYFFVRKFWFVYLAKALVVFPGGFGTCDEFFELITLVQTHKTRKYMPIVLYGSEFWREIINFDALVDWGMINPEDLSLFKIVDDVDTAFEYLRDELTRLYP
ncbi:MAG: LOG family protein [Candidatus Hydrogenedentes bacterium]|nr:LOG family protein [Candidatus Hydrogenedentota bacterium]